MSLIVRFLGTVFALLLITRYVPGFSVDGFYTAAIVAILLGLLSFTVKPVLTLLTLPLNIVTLGLFSFVINAALLLLVASFVEGFAISNFMTAFAGAAILAIVGWILEKITHK